MPKSKKTKSVKIRTVYARKTILVASPVAFHILREGDVTKDLILYHVENYLEENPSPSQFLEDLRKYQNLAWYYSGVKLKRVESPFYKNLEIAKDIFYQSKRNEVIRKLWRFIEKLCIDGKYYAVIKGWSDSFKIANHVNLHNKMHNEILKVLKYKKQANLDFFLPPMIYAGIRKHAA